jgi:VanZ family protein
MDGLSTSEAPCQALRVTFRRLALPLAWTGVIAWFSGDRWGGATTQSLVPLLGALVPWAAPDQLEAIHQLLRKAAHVTEYAVLAALWLRALRPSLARAWPVALALSLATAILDEVHQTTTLTRGGSAVDVLIDGSGAAAALLALAGGAAALERVIGGLLWIAAAGGTGMIALDWAAGAPLGWLSVSAPAGWIALVLWRRRTRPGASPAPP